MLHNNVPVQDTNLQIADTCVSKTCHTVYCNVNRMSVYKYRYGRNAHSHIYKKKKSCHLVTSQCHLLDSC